MYILIFIAPLIRLQSTAALATHSQKDLVFTVEFYSLLSISLLCFFVRFIAIVFSYYIRALNVCLKSIICQSIVCVTGLAFQMGSCNV